MTGLGFLFVMAGAFHFITPQFYMSIMPPYIPRPALIVGVSGAIEVVLGLMLFFEPTRSLAAVGITAFLLAVLPVHVYMLQEREGRFKAYPKAFLWARIPLQFLLMAWAMSYY